MMQHLSKHNNDDSVDDNMGMDKSEYRNIEIEEV
jgi:hypothetical protein